MRIICPLLLIFCLSVLPSAAQDYLLQTFKKHTGRVNALQFSFDGKQILSGGEDRIAKLWETSTGKDVLTFAGHYAEIQTVAFNTPSNQYMASSGNVVLLYDQSGKIITTFRGHTTTIWSLSLHPSFMSFATGSFEKTVRLWEFGKPRFVNQLSGHEENNLAVCYSPCGRYLLSGSLDETIRVWDTKTGETIQVLRGHGGNILSFAFSHDGKIFASGSADNTVRMWSTETWEWLATLPGHEKGVYALDFSPDGRYLISGSADNSIRLWQVKNGNNLYVFKGHTAPVVTLDFQPGTRVFASGSHDGSIMLWEITPELIVRYYYEEELDKEISESELSQPRGSNESRNDFRARQERLENFRKDLITTYYNRYLEEVLKESF
jgi:WD40 repeat protein